MYFASVETIYGKRFVNRCVTKFSMQRFEDTDLELKPIPPPRLVETPDGLANELFGSIAMVTEFISCYKDLFTPKDDSTVINVTTGN